MIHIWSIPLIILGILDDGVNFLDDLASNCITFIYIFYDIKSNFLKNGSTWFTLGELWTLDLFCTNCPSPK
jgi:hypothetical protein